MDVATGEALTKAYRRAPAAAKPLVVRSRSAKERADAAADRRTGLIADPAP